MQEKSKEYNEKEQQILMQVSVGSMMLSGMVRQTEYSLFFSSHRMEPRESCPEMN